MTFSDIQDAVATSLGLVAEEAAALRPLTYFEAIGATSIDLADILHLLQNRLGFTMTEAQSQRLNSIPSSALRLGDILDAVNGAAMDEVLVLTDRWLAALNYARPGLGDWLRGRGVRHCRFDPRQAGPNYLLRFPGVLTEMSLFFDRLYRDEDEAAAVVFGVRPDLVELSGNPFDPQLCLRHVDLSAGFTYWVDPAMLAARGVEVPPVLRELRRTLARVANRAADLLTMRFEATGHTYLDAADRVQDSLACWLPTGKERAGLCLPDVAV